MIILSNRVFRLITGVVVEVAFFIAFYFACAWATGLDSSDLVIAPMFAVLVGLVGQILYDLLDIGFLNEIVGRIIKRVVFYAATVFVFIVCFLMLKETGSSSSLESIKASYGPLSGMFVGGAGFSCGAVASIITVLTRDDTSDERRYVLPFAGAIGLLGSLILGLIFSFMCKDYATLLLVTSIVSVVLLVLFTLFFGLPFDYDDTGFNLISKIMPNRKSRSYSGGGSSSSYSSSGSSRSSSSSGSYSSGSSYTQTDGRKSDWIGNLGLEMNSVASNASRYYSLAYGVGINLHVTYSTYGGNIVFTLSGNLSGTDRLTSEYEANSVRNELQSTLQSVANELVSNASHRIDMLRQEYKDFDRAYKINAKVGNIR